MNELGDTFAMPWAGLWITGLLALATVFLPLVSALLERSGPIRLRHWAEEAGGRLAALYERPARFEAFRFLVSWAARLVPMVFVVVLWVVLDRLRIAGGLWLSAGLTALFLALVEGLSRPLVERHSEKALSLLSPALRPLAVVLRPAAWLLERFFTAAPPPEEDVEDEASEGEIAAFIDVGLRAGIFEPEEEELVRSIVDFGDTQVRSVMTPRVEIASAPAEADLEELARIFFESKHARLPVYRGSIDQIVGILHIRDVFEATYGGRRASAEELVNPPYYVPETKTLRELLQELQTLHQQMAIVLDEYGGVAGLVTVEDLIEEIVGDINDEHEVDDGEQIELGDGRWQLAGRTDLEDLATLFELDLGELPYETVSGLVCGELGYVPKTGETVEVHGLTFAVEEADDRRILQMVVGRVAEAEV